MQQQEHRRSRMHEILPRGRDPMPRSMPGKPLPAEPVGLLDDRLCRLAAIRVWQGKDKTRRICRRTKHSVIEIVGQSGRKSIQPRPLVCLRRHRGVPFAFSPNSISRRIASDRAGFGRSDYPVAPAIKTARPTAFTILVRFDGLKVLSIAWDDARTAVLILKPGIWERWLAA
jgi:hypothetical protein